MKCPRFADWSPIAAVGADLAKPGAILAGDTKQRKLMEIILLQTVEKAPTPQERAKLLDKVGAWWLGMHTWNHAL